ncbi:hypothetical protein B0H14DRAFT_3167456 [Mycena olivaceomarginata]|nr:hypothetical protein B0H14DRAFT_3167456 [Mycena olivaceomarginata]
MYRTAPLWSWRNAAVEDVAGGGRSDAYEDFLSGKKDSTHVIVEARMDPFIPSLLLLFPASFHFSIADLKTWSAPSSPFPTPKTFSPGPGAANSAEVTSGGTPRRLDPTRTVPSGCRTLGRKEYRDYLSSSSFSAGSEAWASSGGEPQGGGGSEASENRRAPARLGWVVGEGDWEEGSSQLHVPSRVAVPEDDEVQAMRLRTCYSLWFDTTANLRRIVSM